VYSAATANKVKTVILIAMFVAIIAAIGWVISISMQRPGIFIPVAIFALVYATVGYFASAKIATAMTGAKEVGKKDAPRLYRTVENMSITAGLPMPKVYVIDDPAPNAFATGRKPDKSIVAATTGLLDMMEDPELEGVIAHEMSHIQNYDIRVMGVVLVLVTIIAFISDFLLHMGLFGGFSDDNREGGAIMIALSLAAAIIAPIAAMLLKAAVSRRRELLADVSGVQLTRYPEGLINALCKIENYSRPMQKANSATAHLFISNPLGKGKASRRFAKLFSTHPPVDERVDQLQEVGREL
jgi:heat shock protein HtpX